MNQSEEGDFFNVRVRENRHWHSGFFTDHDHVHLREMRQRIYKVEKPVTSYEDPPEGSNGVWADLFLWGMRQRVQPTRQQKEAWDYPWTATALHLPDLHGPDTTDQTKESHQEETVTSKDPPRKEPSCSRYGGSTWRSRDQRLVNTTLAVHPYRGSNRKPCPRQIQLYLAWDDNVHLPRDGSSDL